MLQARPEPFTLRPRRTAIVVNDMQNAFCSPGGYLERIGFDISGARKVIDATRRVFDAAGGHGIAEPGLVGGGEIIERFDYARRAYARRADVARLVDAGCDQQRIMALLGGEKEPLSVEELSQKLAAAGSEESIFQITRHLAANKRVRVKSGSSVFEDRYFIQ